LIEIEQKKKYIYRYTNIYIHDEPNNYCISLMACMMPTPHDNIIQNVMKYLIKETWREQRIKSLQNETTKKPSKILVFRRTTETNG